MVSNVKKDTPDRWPVGIGGKPVRCSVLKTPLRGPRRSSKFMLDSHFTTCYNINVVWRYIDT
jgi:hypothetical protein